MRVNGCQTGEKENTVTEKSQCLQSGQLMSAFFLLFLRLIFILAFGFLFSAFLSLAGIGFLLIFRRGFGGDTDRLVIGGSRFSLLFFYKFSGLFELPLLSFGHLSCP